MFWPVALTGLAFALILPFEASAVCLLWGILTTLALYRHD